jgi:hypothetical protein
MNRKPRWKAALEEAAKAAPFLVGLAAVLHELRPYLAHWFG